MAETYAARFVSINATLRSDSAAVPERNEPSESQGQRASPETFEDFFNGHVQFVYRLLLCFGVRDADVDDQVQEVMLVVHRQLDQFDGRSPRGWLYAICMRVASVYRRTLRRRQEEFGVQDASLAAPASQHSRVEHRQAYQRLLDVLDTLEESQRTAFVLHELERLPGREIAKLMNCPLQTAYSRLRLARERVFEAFASDGDQIAPLVNKKTGRGRE